MIDKWYWYELNQLYEDYDKANFVSFEKIELSYVFLKYSRSDCKLLSFRLKFKGIYQIGTLYIQYIL